VHDLAVCVREHVEQPGHLQLQQNVTHHFEEDEVVHINVDARPLQEVVHDLRAFHRVEVAQF